MSEKLNKEQKEARNEKIVAMYQDGKTPEQIAEELDITKKTVLGVLIYNKVYQKPEKPKKEPRKTKAEILKENKVPEELLEIKGVLKLSTESILEINKLIANED